ncbi:MAG: Hpt domain-containing protein [Actinobacteria bacterium]|nr:Hpt domain-containing protein [Actinomycetota bacterium]
MFIAQNKNATGGGDGAGPLENDLGPEVYRELLTDFLSHLTSQLAAIKDAAATGDVPAARRMAHQIKGTALSFGAVHLDELADRLLRLDPDEGELLRLCAGDVEEEVGQLQAD